LHFSVRDTGIGIPREKAAAIFDPFIQAETSTARRYGGTGLGLAISKKLVELMGGRCWVESEVGQGSTFHFTTRLATARNPLPKTEPVLPHHLRHLPVLVVDDNATNRRILAEMLASWGMRPTLAEGGDAALEVLRQATRDGEPFPLVLLDVMMPGQDGFAVAARIKADPSLAQARLIMLSSAGHLANREQYTELGIATFLVKPVRPSELLDAIVSLLSEAGLPQPVRDGPACGIEAPEEASDIPPLRVLLVEDNAVNQLLALRMLERHGHQVTVASNGRQALASLDTESFDLVFMDIQMPEMDGFEATAAIRAWERDTGRHLPIVAMTANAMKGDREACLAAGMDGYVAKPVSTEALLNVMAAVLPTKRAAPAPVDEIPATDTFDVNDFLERLGGDRELLGQLVDLFLTESPPQLAAIRRAIEEGDRDALRRAAHSFKGMISNFGASKGVALTCRLEEMGRAGELSGAEEAFRSLEGLMRRLTASLEALRLQSESRES
jgi:CheY-like chemotaxis protein/HPt (histidine-containing phosphotransfer) domain-containing protein